MTSDIAITINIHAAPFRAEAMISLGAPLRLRFDERSQFPDLVMFTGSPAIAADLATAINDVLERHRAAAEEAA